MKKKIFGLITATDDLSDVANFNKELFDEISKKFSDFYVLNLVNIRIFENKPKKIINNSKLYPKNFKVITFKNSYELNQFFNNKELVGILNLGKTPSFFYIYYLLKKFKTKLILILNLGNFGNDQFINLKLKFGIIKSIKKKSISQKFEN